jgi:5'-nucleotidase
VRILLTNDDGIYAPGLTAMHAELLKLGDVEVSAPAANQSGVGHSITYLTPLIVQEVFHGEQHYGWEIAGSPADCVKLAMLELCQEPPDLIVSGINGGANAGINVLYSGTVAAAIEGAFFGVMSIAVSLAMNEHPNFERTARHARELIEQLLERRSGVAQLWNINFPEATLEGPRGVKVLPMGVHRYGEFMERRKDPRGRTYYWSGSDKQLSPPCPVDTDVQGMLDGYITMTPLQFDMTQRVQLDLYRDLKWKLNDASM